VSPTAFDFFKAGMHCCLLQWGCKFLKIGWGWQKVIGSVQRVLVLAVIVAWPKPLRNFTVTCPFILVSPKTDDWQNLAGTAFHDQSLHCTYTLLRSLPSYNMFSSAFENLSGKVKFWVLCCRLKYRSKSYQLRLKPRIAKKWRLHYEEVS